ncbi:hypothetical protein BDM02DRAFT_3190815 [Thelephora ganbajun]|uniref:Uncharacterized protein n=1 Tax=Thelephora ganbajun TaxID=370292 RepID=A0ACB6Z381_THEGA|nr:hypothetical protein BDM02DRAFT_3190815 [Thelephora ganbajun]
MSSDVLKEIIDVGHDITAIKYYEVAVATVLFYDYLLTLADEVRYAWHGSKSWVFALFLVNRYTSFGYQFWALTYFLAFSLIIYLVARSNVYRFQIPSLLRIIVQDATHYFMIIFTSHLALELTLLFERPTIQLLPAIGNVVYLPVMITRLMLSLKKATVTREYAWSLGEPTLNTVMGFAERRGPANVKDEIPLDTYAGKHEEGTQSTVAV